MSPTRSLARALLAACIVLAPAALSGGCGPSGASEQTAEPVSAEMQQQTQENQKDYAKRIAEQAKAQKAARAAAKRTQARPSPENMPSR